MLAKVETYGLEPAGAAVAAAMPEAERFAALWDRRVASPPSPEGATIYAELCSPLRGAVSALSQSGPHPGLRAPPRRGDARCWTIPMPSSSRCGSTTPSTTSVPARTSGAAPRCFWTCRQEHGSCFRHRVCGLIMATRHARSDPRQRPALHGRHRSLRLRRAMGGIHAQRRAAARGVAAHQTDAQYHAGAEWSSWAGCSSGRASSSHRLFPRPIRGAGARKPVAAPRGPRAPGLRAARPGRCVSASSGRGPAPRRAARTRTVPAPARSRVCSETMIDVPYCLFSASSRAAMLTSSPITV